MRYLTAGESHGPQLTAIIEGFPAGLTIDFPALNAELAERQKGYGRGGRMKIETDTVECVAGVRQTVTLGSPICLVIENKDYVNWQKMMHPMEVTGEKKPQTTPRPGHADLVGALKYNHEDDVRNVLERASARETAIHVAMGALAQQLLQQLDITVTSRVCRVGAYEGDEQNQEIRRYIDQLREAGDTVGGEVEVIVNGLPAGLGSYVHYDRKLDGILAQAVMSVNACKAVGFGLATELGKISGSAAHDQIFYESGAFTRQTNRTGGIEGGMSNGMPIIVRATLKPIPTLMQPLQTVDLLTKTATASFRERSDVSVVEAFAIIVKNVVAQTIAQQLCSQLRSDTLGQLQTDVKNLRMQMKG
ncbi:MAG: chorismate synthase [Culicoidibacterales bacterium]